MDLNVETGLNKANIQLKNLEQKKRKNLELATTITAESQTGPTQKTEALGVTQTKIQARKLNGIIALVPMEAELQLNQQPMDQIQLAKQQPVERDQPGVLDQLEVLDRLQTGRDLLHQQLDQPNRRRHRVLHRVPQKVLHHQRLGEVLLDQQGVLDQHDRLARLLMEHDRRLH